MYKLELQNACKAFDSFLAVDSVSLAIPEGESWVLLGPSGCGKTTTLRMIAGFMIPDSGEIHIDGNLVAGGGTFVPPHKRGIGMVFQSYAVWPHKTVYENIVYGLKIQKVSAAERDRRVLNAIELVQLDGLADRYPAMLSGGQQQRVSLARAIVIEPTLLLLDEPLSNLDAKLREQMRFDLKRLQEQLGLTTVYVTHDQAEAMVIADHIVVMEKGRIVQVGSAEEIYGRPKSNFVASFMGHSNLLPGEVLSVDDDIGAFVIHLQGVGEVRAPRSVAHENPIPGQRGFLCMRPENIHLKSPSDQNVVEGWDGVVTMRTYLGAEVDYRVKVGDFDDLRVTMHPSQNFRSDDRVIVSINPGDCSWLVG
jgi:ABC-type Fe3+/spermidine/putrescine transport system ATPase subunit